MKVVATNIPDVKVIEPQVHADSRGYFFEAFSQRIFAEKVADVAFVQDNESRSTKGVIRGLHFQKAPHAQAKLVRCVQGRVLDVAVDIRPDSSTFGQWTAVELSGENHLQLFIPEGFAHGFAALSDEVVLNYKCSAYYAPEAEAGFNPFSPALGIDWGIAREDAILNDRDLSFPSF